MPDEPILESTMNGRSNCLGSGSWLRSGWPWFAGVGLATVATITFIWFPRVESAEASIRDARAALAQGDPQRAQQLAEGCINQYGDLPAALVVAGQAAVDQGLLSRALDLFSRVDRQASEAVTALYWCGNLSIQLGKAKDAESFLRQTLTRDPAHIDANNYLVFLLKVQGRNWELRPHMWRLMQQGQFAESYLGPLAFPDVVFLNSSEIGFIEVCQKAVPGDLLPLLGQARLAISRTQIAQAKELLLSIAADNGDNLEVQAQLGLALMESGSDGEFVAWRNRLPKAAEDHPAIWFLWGRWARDHGQVSASLRCFWETVRLDPNHAAANYQLSKILSESGQAAAAEVFLKRFQSLSRLDRLVRISDDDQGHSPERIKDIVDTMESLGRPWEALAWSNVVLTRHPRLAWARRKSDQLSLVLDSTTPLTLVENSPSHLIDLSHQSLPVWPHDGTKPGRPTPEASGDCRVVFTDEASRTGLNFFYQNGASADDNREHIYEFSGGGVSVLDYDADGWPDLYLTQGMERLNELSHTPITDRLFRNIGGERFEDVTEQSLLAETGYSGGAAIGDFDSDGFPDLYVANIGGNRFYRNNGDGSFADVTSETRTAGDEWSLSCLLADLNGDSLPDLYVVNYLRGSDIFSRSCQQQEVVVQCPPSYFETEQDRLYLNLGDGHFQDVTNESGIVRSGGRGMGIVAADFDGSRRLSLFVANDGNANFLFQNETLSQGGPVRFSEQGIIRGLSFDEQGQALGSMGVAAGDCNGDHRLDLLVTNFLAEVNNLYTQGPDGTFEDYGRQANVHQTGQNRVAWGTQFLDAELDGDPDLVIANGHLGRYAAAMGQPTAMHTLYLSNSGDGRFRTIESRQLGTYFGQSVLGRAIAVLDWNRDGLDDFCVTHVDSPVALLTNRTPRPGHAVAVHLRGVASSRDAIGTVVNVSSKNHHLTRQLTAGDGYQASNEKRLVFGLGNDDHIDELVIEWPSGLRQIYRDVDVDSELLFVEGHSRPSRLPRSE